MSLEGPRFPQLHYARSEDDAVRPTPEEEATDTLRKALELARQLEELLEETRSSLLSARVPPAVEDARAHSTRMARAFAASLVDELAALVRPVRNTAS